ncbi:endonuclease III [Lactobacillus sp. DCY120]|uniref:Endonuclease III n=1 Tax=Bombilactobacillus apium TaxID=2675299 RepID=A0A850R8T8_9LACO|nr:endonuclease III [Bombilactobacillus apium]NVY95816.1 endonuclease III [Bombilactobacillus apium]
MLTDPQIVTAMQMIMDEFPQAGPSLDARTNFQYMISVVLSAQTTDKAVNKITPKLFQKYPNPEDLAQATVPEVEELIKSIGLYHNKARHIIACAQEVLANFGGEVPHTKKELTTLSGVGTKTANVVLADRFQVPAFAVDTHVSHISQRLHFVAPKSSVQVVEKRVTQALDPKDWIHGHHALIEMGRKYNFNNEAQIKDLPVVRQCDQWEQENQLSD